jgi:hypothetical protein
MKFTDRYELLKPIIFKRKIRYSLNFIGRTLYNESCHIN